MALLLSLFYMFCWSLLVSQSSCGLFDWILSGSQNEDNLYRPLPNIHNLNDENDNTDLVLSMKIPFELSSTDERFVNELDKYTSQPLTELDKCNHKVIVTLQQSCEEMTEEDLSKVAVNLLNCQSAIENRQIYPCNKDMAIHECTRKMDLNTWNAYHIISNRARAVCYHLRQVQFKAKTEMTVNQLVNSAHNQILTMQRLQESQNELQDFTSKSMEEASSNHKQLIQQQRNLTTSQMAMQSFVSANMRELGRERSLIASGQRELSRITQNIRQKLERARNDLVSQGESQRVAHQRILDELFNIHEGAAKVWTELDLSASKILETHQKTVQHYDQLMADLQTINQTVHHLINIVNTMKVKLEEKFSWISILIGDTGQTVEKLNLLLVHGTYFVVGMVAASFLQVPYVTRMALVLIVPLNAVSEAHHDTSLPFSTLTIILAVFTLGNIAVSSLVKFYRWQRSPPQLNSVASEIKLHSRNDSHLRTYGHNALDISDCEDTGSVYGGEAVDSSFKSVDRNHANDFNGSLDALDSVRQRLMLPKREDSPNRSKRGHRKSSRSATPLGDRSAKVLCSGYCKNGQKCRLNVSQSSIYCHLHTQ